MLNSYFLLTTFLHFFVKMHAPLEHVPQDPKPPPLPKATTLSLTYKSSHAFSSTMYIHCICRLLLQGNISFDGNKIFVPI